MILLNDTLNVTFNFKIGWADMAESAVDLSGKFFLLVIGITLSLQTSAKVSLKEAERLSADLTPLGADRTGNAEGSIPPWTGGIISPPSGYSKGGPFIDPFASDQVLLKINKGNMQKHAAKLSDGHKALLTEYSSTYFMNVYPSRRSASYPEFVYNAAKENALKSALRPRGTGIIDGKVTSPFPIPQNGAEVIWNHMLRYRGLKASLRGSLVVPTRGGDYNPVTGQKDYFFIYAQPDLDLKRLENKIFYFKSLVLSPAKQAGTMSLVHESLDQITSPRKAWQYFPGQRRLRRAPKLAYDSPGPASDGFRTADQSDMYNGAPDQYEWNLSGKRELYIPYNAYQLYSKNLTISDIIKPKHINQNYPRYELHRVWVVEGKLRVGINHIYKKRRLYFDEDSWQIVLTEEYDEGGKLWRVSEGHAINFYSAKVIWTALETVYDLQSGRYVADNLANEQSPRNFEPKFTIKDFSTSAVRRAAKR